MIGTWIFFMTCNDQLHDFDGNNHSGRPIHREIKVLCGHNY